MLAECDLMTFKGWKNIKDITKEDSIACRIGNKVEFYYPLEIERAQRSELISFKSTQLDLLVTPEHLLWIRIQKGPHRFCRADRFIGRKTDLYFKKTFPWYEIKDYEVVRVPERKLYRGKKHEYFLRVSTFLSFLGWVFSDGGVSYNSISITQTKHIDKVKECLENLWVKYSVRPQCSGYTKHWNARRFTVHSIQLREIIKGYFTNGIPYEIKNMSRNKIAILLNSFFYGNGDFHGKRKLFVRLNKKLADDIQEMVLKCGFSSNLRRVGNMYVVTIGKDKVHTLETHRRPVKRIIQKQDVFSCTVPGGLIFVRRGGKCCWIGN